MVPSYVVFSFQLLKERNKTFGARTRIGNLAEACAGFGGFATGVSSGAGHGETRGARGGFWGDSGNSAHDSMT